jgi:type IV secretory pathway component VirB8
LIVKIFTPLHEIKFISLSIIPPSRTADFVVIVLQTEYGQAKMIMPIKDYHLLQDGTDFFQNKYVSYKEDHSYIEKKIA